MISYGTIVSKKKGKLTALNMCLPIIWRDQHPRRMLSHTIPCARHAFSIKDGFY